MCRKIKKNPQTPRALPPPSPNLFYNLLSLQNQRVCENNPQTPRVHPPPPHSWFRHWHVTNKSYLSWYITASSLAEARKAGGGVQDSSSCPKKPQSIWNISRGDLEICSLLRLISSQLQLGRGCPFMISPPRSACGFPVSTENTRGIFWHYSVLIRGFYGTKSQHIGTVSLYRWNLMQKLTSDIYFPL